MSPRTGRPPKDNPRDCSINLRLTKEELDKVQTAADALNISRTDAIIKGIDLLLVEIANN